MKGRRDPIDRVPRGGVAGPSLVSEVAPPTPWDAINRVPTPFCAMRKQMTRTLGNKEH